MASALLRLRLHDKQHLIYITMKKRPYLPKALKKRRLPELTAFKTIRDTMKNRLIRLVSLPEGIPQAANFSLEEEKLGDIDDNQLLVKTLYLSVDPYLRAKMAGHHLPAFKANDIMSSRAVAEVISSRHKGFTKGDYVVGFLDWKEYSISDGNGLMKLADDNVPLTAHLGVLGSTGLSAYFALQDIGKPKKKGDTLVV